MGEDKPANSVDKIPVILDTDIGMDVDDVWALVFLLCCPELDVKLITTATGDTAYRAALTAKILDLAGRADIPIGVGLPLDQSPRTHDAWLAGYQIADYPGDVLRDGVGALCDTVMASQEKVSIVSIGPVPNIAAALAREPNITANAKFIGMHGSLRRGYMGAEKPMREYNVKLHSLACQAVFQANWERLITPLDTCGTIVLEDGRFDAVQASDKLLTQIALQNHALWFEAIAEFQQTVAGTDAFFMEAAKCAFDPGGLDSALVVRKIDGVWQIAASYVPSPELGIGFQSTIVERAAANRKTVFHDSNLISSKSYRNDADFVVAAPVFDDGVVFVVLPRLAAIVRIGQGFAAPRVGEG